MCATAVILEFDLSEVCDVVEMSVAPVENGTVVVNFDNRVPVLVPLR